MDNLIKINRSVSVVTNYFSELITAFEELGKKFEPSDVEHLSVELVRATCSSQRTYHRPEHSIDVGRGHSSLGRLAGIFHDCVYVQIDSSWKENFGWHLRNFIPSDELKLNTHFGFNNESDLTRKAVIVLFGMEKNSKVVPGQGLNEVLSALVMQSMLTRFLTPKEIISIAACIESTIPFRKADANGRTPMKALKVRLDKAIAILNMTITESEKQQIVDLCREIIEKDLASFASKKFSFFISNTWNVMNENNPSLKNSFFYVSEYRRAVHGVIPFLKSLDPDQMFWTPPTDLRARDVVERTKKNLKLGLRYLKIVGLSLSIVESVALETGGDLPYETLVGALRRGREHQPHSVREFLPKEISKILNEEDRDIYFILKNGRDLRTPFDRKDCPIGFYLFQNLTHESLESLFDSALKVHSGELSPFHFLSQMPIVVLTEIIDALSYTSVIRTRQMQALLTKFQGVTAA